MNDGTIAAIESLKDQGRYKEAIDSIVEGIANSTDVLETARYLINLIVCATNLCEEKMAFDAIRDIYKLSLPANWEPIRNYIAAVSYLDFDQPQMALELIKKNLDNEIILADEFSKQRYDNLSQYGFALTHTGRFKEALLTLDEAERLCPNGELNTQIKLYKITCLGKLGGLDEAFVLAEDVANNQSGDLSVRGRYHMAEIRLEQGRFSEAISLYREVEKSLPCTWVSAADVSRDIEAAMDALIKSSQVIQ